jgi:hypothetical protein
MADNAELSNLRDTVEELKYLEGKVVSILVPILWFEYESLIEKL